MRLGADSIASSTGNRFVISAMAALGVCLFAVPTVSANLSPPVEFRSLSGGFLTTFITNLPVNLFLLSLMLLVTGWAVGRKLCVLPDSKWVFIVSLAAAVLIITLTGSAIDIGFLYEEEDGTYTLTANFENWAIAAVLVLASVYLTIVFTMKVNIVFGLIPALTMMVANILWWNVLGGHSAIMAPALVLSLFCLMLSPLPVLELLRWQGRIAHKKEDCA